MALEPAIINAASSGQHILNAKVVLYNVLGQAAAEILQLEDMVIGNIEMKVPQKSGDPYLVDIAIYAAKMRFLWGTSSSSYDSVTGTGIVCTVPSPLLFGLTENISTYTFGMKYVRSGLIGGITVFDDVSIKGSIGTETPCLFGAMATGGRIDQILIDAFTPSPIKGNTPLLTSEFSIPHTRVVSFQLFSTPAGNLEYTASFNYPGISLCTWSYNNKGELIGKSCGTY
jgi:hypothetical protein